MSVHIDSAEVLYHLKNYGISSIDDEAFKLFIKDLKKLIKYEQRSICHNALNFETNPAPTVLQFHDVNLPNTYTNDSLRTPHKFQRYETAYKNVPKRCNKAENYQSSSGTNGKISCCCCSGNVSFSLPKAEDGRCMNGNNNCSCGSPLKHNSDRIVFANCSKSYDKKQLNHCNVNIERRESCKKCNSTTSEKSKTDEQNIQRPLSLTSCARSRTSDKSKKLQCDPVGLYQYYQSIWKHHKLPGENDHAQLRHAIRNRLMNAK